MEEEDVIPFKQFFPSLSLSSYFWVVICLSAVIFSVGGYLVGMRVNQLPPSAPYQQFSAGQQFQPNVPVTNQPGDDNDTDYFTIGGIFTTDTAYYDQLVITIDSIQNGVRTNLDTDTRYITKPQAGVQYPYSFDRLDPYKSYSVTASACATDPRTFALICAKHIAMSVCSGKRQGDACIITGNSNQTQSSGAVSFSIASADNPTPTPTTKN